MNIETVSKTLEKNRTKQTDDNIEVPRQYYNLRPDLPTPLAPIINPGTKEPLSFEELEPLFPKRLVELEFSNERYIDIPEPLREFYYSFGRPTPLMRLKRLEMYLNTPAKIFLKREDVSPTGSHKINTAIAQAYYAFQEGTKKLTTETGAGQWGSALSLSASLIRTAHGAELDCEVFMVRCSYDQKPFRKTLMNLYDATIHASPSPTTKSGRKILKENPDHPGTLGIAISEAVERAMEEENTKYSLGSVLNGVLINQSVIGLEVEQQFKAMDQKPDYLIGCVGGGSNFSGLVFPLRKAFPEAKIIAAESTACPALTTGLYKYDFADTLRICPMIKGHTVGHDYTPPPIHAGGLRYHSTAPMVSNLLDAGEVTPYAYPQTEIYEAGKILAQTEGLIAAPETNHAIKAAIDIARAVKKTGEKANIVVSYSGHGLLDLTGYEEFLNNNLIDV